MLPPLSAAAPDLSIIIVSWNVCDLLRACLRSVYANSGELSLEVIVVDSNSADGSAAMVRDEFPTVALLACSENVGFPRGNNIGLAQAHGRAILLLNPDTLVIKDALSQMVGYLAQHPKVGVLGPQLLNEDGTVQSSRRRFPQLVTALFESTWLQPYAPAAVLRRYYMDDLPDGVTAEVDWLTGACLLLPRQVVEQVGPMDEAYFMYSEELDWCRRIRQAGWKVIYFPAAKIIHLSGKSSEQASTARHINFNRAKLRYFRKYHGRLTAALIRVWLLAGFAMQLLIEGAKWLAGHKRPLRQQRIQAYWQVVRSGLRAAGY